MRVADRRQRHRRRPARRQSRADLQVVRDHQAARHRHGAHDLPFDRGITRRPPVGDRQRRARCHVPVHAAHRSRRATPLTAALASTSPILRRDVVGNLVERDPKRAQCSRELHQGVVSTLHGELVRRAHERSDVCCGAVCAEAETHTTSPSTPAQIRRLMVVSHARVTHSATRDPGSV
jgi:hypothetical protein